MTGPAALYTCGAGQIRQNSRRPVSFFLFR
jgi:hypothetical protein